MKSLLVVAVLFLSASTCYLGMELVANAEFKRWVAVCSEGNSLRPAHRATWDGYRWSEYDCGVEWDGYEEFERYQEKYFVTPEPEFQGGTHEPRPAPDLKNGEQNA